MSKGLADSIGSLDDAIAEFSADLSNEKDDNMFTQEQLDAAVASATASAKAEGIKEGAASGATAERERILAITGSDEGQARPVAAMAAAMDTDMSAEQATKFLAKLPEEKTEAAAPKTDANGAKGKDGAAADFSQAMNGADHPDVGSPAAKTEEQVRAERRKSAMTAAGRLRAVE